MADYTLSKERRDQQAATYSDAEFAYAIGKKYVLDFFHIPTGISVQFKGMVSAFSDQYSSNWDKEPVYGRADPIQTFKNIERIISLSWSVVAADEAEARENMKRASTLLKMLYPAYEDDQSNAGHISAAPLFKLAFANLIHNQAGGAGSKRSVDAKTVGLVGSLSGFTYEPNMDGGFFDPEPGLLFPQELVLSCEFSVLHTHRLGWAKRKARSKGFDRFPYGSKNPPDIRRITIKSGARTDNQKTAAENKLLRSRQ